jgi:hypothetical protein
LECQTVRVTFLSSLSQFGTTCTDLGSEEMSLHALSKCYVPVLKCCRLVSRVLAFTGQGTG